MNPPPKTTGQIRETDVIRWAAMWRSQNKLDGMTRHLIFENCLPKLFRTKKQTKQFIDKTHGYIRYREDLRSEPHGWRMPVPVKVIVRIVSQSTK